MFHKNLTGLDIHTPITFVYATESARLSATGFFETDLGKFCFVQETSLVYILLGVAPISWLSLAGSSFSVNGTPIEAPNLQDGNVTLTPTGSNIELNYELPTATNEVLGGIKVGSGLSIDDGVLSAAAPVEADTLQTVTTRGSTTTTTVSVAGVNYDATKTDVPLTEGQTSWNSTTGCLEIGMPNGSTLQVGKESYIDYQNNTGTTFDDGIPLMYGSAIGASGKIRAVKAIANGTLECCYFLGLATSQVLDGDTGLATAFGDIHGINTTGSNYGETWADGDPIYVSATTAGYLTKTKPQAPNYTIQVGFIVNAHANSGTIKLMPHHANKLVDLADVNGTPVTTDGQIPVWDNTNKYFDFTQNIFGRKAYHGVVARSTAGGLNCLPAYITSTTFTLGATANPISYYFDSKLVTVSTDKTATLTDGTAGYYYVYFNTMTGNILATKTFPGISCGDNVIIASIIWNGTNYGLVLDERHGYQRNCRWHEWAHKTIGVRYVGGFDFVASGTGAGATFTMSGGELMDEDIDFSAITSSSYPTPNAIRTFYQASASYYAFDNATSTIPYKAGTGSRPVYVKASDYSLVTMDSAPNRYINFFIYGTPDLHTPIYCITESVSDAVAADNGYTSLANARAIPFPNLAGFNLSPELKPLYRLIVRADGVVQTLTSADDYRRVTSLPYGAGTTSTTASAVTFSPNGNISSVNVQLAIEELDAEKLSATITDPGIGQVITFNGDNWVNADASGGSTEPIYFFEGTTAAELQTLINKVSTSGGGTILLKAVTYVFDVPVTVPNKVSLVGAGVYSTLLDFSLATFTDSLIKIGGQYQNFSDFSVKGGGTTLETRSCFDFVNAATSDIYGVYFKRVDTIGIEGYSISVYQNVGSLAFYGFRIEDCDLEGQMSAIRLQHRIISNVVIDNNRLRTAKAATCAVLLSMANSTLAKNQYAVTLSNNRFDRGVGNQQYAIFTNVSTHIFNNYFIDAWNGAARFLDIGSLHTEGRVLAENNRIIMQGGGIVFNGDWCSGSVISRNNVVTSSAGVFLNFANSAFSFESYQDSFSTTPNTVQSSNTADQVVGITFLRPRNSPKIYLTKSKESCFIYEAPSVNIVADPFNKVIVRSSNYCKDAFTVDGNLNVGSGDLAVNSTTGVVSMGSTPVYTDNTAALAGGLVAGDTYRTATGTLMITY